MFYYVILSIKRYLVDTFEKYIQKYIFQLLDTGFEMGSIIIFFSIYGNKSVGKNILK